MISRRRLLLGTLSLAYLPRAWSLDRAGAASLYSEAQGALKTLYAKTPAAKTLQARAIGILVFPDVTKAGLMVGGQYGEGVLTKKGQAAAYYSTAGMSYGLQLGAQTYGYALFLMNQHAIEQLDAAKGFEVGVGPTVVVVDDGMARSLTSTTLKDDIYAFIFNQHGLMAGVGVQGNKLTRIEVK